MGRSSPRFDWLAAWILGSAWAQLAGWGLSAVGQLNRGGYLVALLLFLGTLFCWRRTLREPSTRPVFLVRRSTYARGLPRAWLALTILAFIGGVLSAPDNFDYLTYRFPRVLHWWWDDRWTWLHTPEDRQNASAIGMEWLMAPLLVLFRTDRLFFLINFVSFLFLPGLIFSVFRQAGVAGRVAWSWMWLLPGGFCFILQAASMGNDSFAAVYFLAALHYARRARNGSTLALVLSILSIALVTGAKASNIPLIVPWLAVLWMQGRRVLAAVRTTPLVAVALVGIIASFLPIGVINILHTGSYTGDPSNVRRLQTANPVIGVVGNSLQVGLGNLAPPVWPHEFKWPHQDEIQAAIQSHGFPRFGLTGVPFQVDETAGIGPGVLLLSILGAIYGLRRRIAQPRRPGAWLLAGSVLVAWLGYMSKMGSEAGQRLVAVYYVAGILALLVVLPVNGLAIHRAGWRLLAAVTMLMAFPLVILSPARPILPVPWIDAALRLARVPAAVIEHLDEGYRLRAQRRDELHDLRQAIPADQHAIGVMGSDDEPAVSLWLPFGSRGTVELFPNDPGPAARHLRYVAVSSDRLRQDNVQLDDLLKKWSLEIVAQQPLRYTLRRGTQTWYLLRVTP